VPGVTSIWREVKTWQHYAYVTNENGDGIQIINLAYLPDSVQTTQWYGDSTISGTLITCHALHIDSGYLYLFGCGDGATKLFHGAAILCDLNADPWNPHYLGILQTWEPPLPPMCTTDMPITIPCGPVTFMLASALYGTVRIKQIPS
jgi:hypothetical protein